MISPGIILFEGLAPLLFSNSTFCSVFYETFRYQSLGIPTTPFLGTCSQIPHTLSRWFLSIQKVMEGAHKILEGHVSKKQNCLSIIDLDLQYKEHIEQRRKLDKSQNEKIKNIKMTHNSLFKHQPVVSCHWIL